MNCDILDLIYNSSTSRKKRIRKVFFKWNWIIGYVSTFFWILPVRTSTYPIEVFISYSYPCMQMQKQRRTGFICLSDLHWSTFLTRSTTGTEVHGIMPRSVITRSTKSGGVTSYTKFRRPKDLTVCQSFSWVFPFRVTIRSSGSSVKTSLIYYCNFF